jgi:hypothetical protein
MLPPFVGAPDATAVRSLRFPATQRVELFTNDGAVRVAVNNDASYVTCEISADIRLYRTALGRHGADPAQYIGRVVSADADAGAIRIHSLPNDWPADLAAIVNYTITVPRGTNIGIRGVNGNVWVAEGCRDVSVESGNADVEIRKPFGPVVASSTNGRLRLYGARGRSALETVNGNIRADVLSGWLTAASVNGRVQAEVLGPEVLACALRSENGDVKVGLGADIGFTLDAAAARGSVRGDTGLALDSAAPGAFRSRAGSGETRLTLNSANGSIRLTRR